MRRFRPLLWCLVALAIPWLARPADACPYSFSYAYSTPAVYNQSYYAPSYNVVVPAVKEKIILVPVAFAIYGAGYVPSALAAPAPAAAPAKSPCDQQIDALKKEMQELRQQMRAPPPERLPSVAPMREPEAMQHPPGGDGEAKVPRTSFADLTAIPQLKRADMALRVDVGNMPSRAAPLADADAKEFKEYAMGKPVSARLVQVVQESCVKCHR